MTRRPKPKPKPPLGSRPTSLRLTAGDLEYADLLVGPEAVAKADDRYTQHRLLLEAVRLGLAVIGQRHGIPRPKPK